MAAIRMATSQRGSDAIPTKASFTDTTIVASLAAGSDHIDHVNAQLPYALLVAAVSVVLYTVAAILL